jgi:anti-sigma B factor antagonist
MKLSFQEYEHICVLTLSGEFTAEDSAQFTRVTGDRLAGGARHVLLDCEHLEFIDSAGVEHLLRLSEDVGRRSGQVRLIGLSDNVRKIFEMTRHDRSFEDHPTVEAAVRSVR